MWSNLWCGDHRFRRRTAVYTDLFNVIRMDIDELTGTPGWDWDEGARESILTTLTDFAADPEERLRAVEMLSESPFMDDALAAVLLDLVTREGEIAELRSRAAIALGPALEEMDLFFDDGYDEPVVSMPTFQRIRETLRRTFHDAEVPEPVRRRVLEASIRAPEDWHAGAVRAAYYSEVPEWRITGVFCMGMIPGFQPEILEALVSPDPAIRGEAVVAAGRSGLRDAWPAIRAILLHEHEDRELLIAAIEAAVEVNPDDAEVAIAPLLESEDDEVEMYAREALERLEVEDLADWSDEFDENF